MFNLENQDDILWAEGLEIVRKLESGGFQAFLVGGCVRDRLLGRTLHDIDIATSATPNEVMAQFARTLPTGLKHGTVTVLEGGRAFEVTTFRQESGYSDARRPDEVEFVLDVREDLARRDFTFNAMAVGIDGEIVDPFGGQDALRAGVVQCVGDPSERFSEDALRMVRAIRFAAELEFELLPDVWQSIVKHRPKLKQVAIERISSEWDKMMAGNGPELACHYLFKSGLLMNLKESLPESIRHAIERYRFNELSWEWDKWGMSVTDEGSLGNLNQLPLLFDPDLRWAALLIGMGINETASMELCRTLRLNGRRAARIAAIAGLDEKWKAYEEPLFMEEWIGLVLDYGRPIAEDWLEINEVCGSVHLEDMREWLAKLTVCSIADLHVRGDELSNHLKQSPGPWIASMLQRLLEEVAFGTIPNDKRALLELAEEMASFGYED